MISEGTTLKTRALNFAEPMRSPDSNFYEIAVSRDLAKLLAVKYSDLDMVRLHVQRDKKVESTADQLWLAARLPAAATPGTTGLRPGLL